MCTNETMLASYLSIKMNFKRNTFFNILALYEVLIVAQNNMKIHSDHIREQILVLLFLQFCI